MLQFEVAATWPPFRVTAALPSTDVAVPPQVEITAPAETSPAGNARLKATPVAAVLAADAMRTVKIEFPPCNTVAGENAKDTVGGEGGAPPSPPPHADNVSSRAAATVGRKKTHARRRKD